jgi:hypothetical protein
MDDDHELILIAAYRNLDSAKTDFRELEKRVKHGLEVKAAALVTKDADGQPHVVEAHNKHGRVAAGMAPGWACCSACSCRRSASRCWSAGRPGRWSSFADHEVRTGLKREVGEALQAGTGVVICLVYPNGRGPMESTLYRADDFRAVRMDRTSIESLDALVAEEMAKIAPSPSEPASAGTTDTST